MHNRLTIALLTTLTLTLTACGGNAGEPQAETSESPCDSIVQAASNSTVDAETATETVNNLWNDMADPESDTVACYLEGPFKEEYYPEAKLAQLSGAISRTEPCELKVNRVEENDDFFRTVTNLEECPFLKDIEYFGWTVSKNTGLVSGSHTAVDGKSLSRNYLDAK